MDGCGLECAEVFLRDQEKLLGERVLETVEEAQDFLEDCFAVVLSSAKEIREYWKENGMDTQGMSDRDILESEEVFELSGGRYLVVDA